MKTIFKLSFAIFVASMMTSCIKVEKTTVYQDNPCTTCPPDDGTGGVTIDPNGVFLGVALSDPAVAGTYLATNGMEITMSNTVFCTESFGDVLVYLTPSQASGVAADNAESGAHFSECDIVGGQITTITGGTVDVWLIAGNSRESDFGCWSGKRPGGPEPTENRMSRADFLDKEQKIEDDVKTLEQLFKDHKEKKEENTDTEVSE